MPEAAAQKALERAGWFSSTRSRVFGITGAVLLCVAGVLYVKWQPEHGCEEKTRTVLNAGSGDGDGAEKRQPPPLTLEEVKGANLLRILQQRELSLGRNAIALRLDKDQCARLGICDVTGMRHEFRLSDSGTLSKAVSDTLKQPEKSGFGFVIEKRDGKYVLRASAAGFVARVNVEDIDDGIDGVLHDRRKQESCPEELLQRGGLRPSHLSLPYRAKKPWSLNEEESSEIISLLPVEREPAPVVAKHP